MTARYESMPYRVYVRDDGKRASIHGAVPWTSDAEKSRWKVVEAGWTIYDNHTNTSGIGRKPFETREEAQHWIDNRKAL